MFEKLFSDKYVTKKYIEAGLNFGFAVSELYMGECFGFSSMLDNLENGKTNTLDVVSVRFLLNYSLTLAGVNHCRVKI